METLKFIISSSKQNRYFDGFLCEHDIEILSIVSKIDEMNNIKIKDCECRTLISCCVMHGYLSCIKYLYEQSSTEG
ncbi:MAG: hypothetical protein KAS12_06480, partial [Candidatus Aenigmarchaeota archaeon]|nr:hypothetical protein [Candidatus Aenigmarchaeota archaeon]